jgi:hypothetical protein
VETDIVKYLTLDIGGGQFHQCEVTLQHQLQGTPKLRMAASLLDEGTIGIARAVREQLRVQHPGIRLSDAEAQQVLVSWHALIEGRRTPVNGIVSEVIAARSQNLLTHLRHQLQTELSDVYRRRLHSAGTFPSGTGACQSSDPEFSVCAQRSGLGA